MHCRYALSTLTCLEGSVGGFLALNSKLQSKVSLNKSLFITLQLISKASSYVHSSHGYTVSRSAWRIPASAIMYCCGYIVSEISNFLKYHMESFISYSILACYRPEIFNICASEVECKAFSRNESSVVDWCHPVINGFPISEIHVKLTLKSAAFSLICCSLFILSSKWGALFALHSP